ncbi:hypothetical protein BGZ52_009316 [Haplosporangium bisporale]|nr:hypothetical protein BGZ52_009316 [Haplosporangium bisporale]
MASAYFARKLIAKEFELYERSKDRFRAVYSDCMEGIIDFKRAVLKRHKQQSTEEEDGKRLESTDNRVGDGERGLKKQERELLDELGFQVEVSDMMEQDLDHSCEPTNPRIKNWKDAIQQ